MWAGKGVPAKDREPLRDQQQQKAVTPEGRRGQGGVMFLQQAGDGWLGHRAGRKGSETIYLGAQMEKSQDGNPRLGHQNRGRSVSLSWPVLPVLSWGVVVMWWEKRDPPRDCSSWHYKEGCRGAPGWLSGTRDSSSSPTSGAEFT